MMIRGVPVPVRSLRRFISDYLRFELQALEPSPLQIEPFLHLLFFSCARDFLPLCLSLRSARRLEPKLIKTTMVYVDDKDPFSDEQRAELKSLAPNLSFGISKGFAWASMGTLETELNAFALVAKRAAPGDYIVKVDSDILFFSTRKMLLLARLNYEFIGDGHHEGYRYSQGGLYFIREDLARNLAFKRVETQVKAIVSKLGDMSEDMVVYNLVKDMRKRILLTNLMLFPREYEGVRSFSGIIGKLFIAIHFVKRKHEMGSYLRRFEQ